MARNGSGTMTPAVDFTTEAASPPIEISKLDTFADDIADEITNSIAADGQTNPTANLKMNGFKLTNLGAATALTDAVSATVVIDQELQYYVDSGSANTYVITPSPAIAAYEEGQRFVVRIANASSGASTLNVNGLGAIAIQTADATAVASGTLAAGGIYEFTYDANTSPDRWVVTSPTSKIPDGMLSSNIPLKDATNDFTGAAQRIKGAGAGILYIQDPGAGAGLKNWMLRSLDGEFVIQSMTDAESGVENAFRATMDASSTITLVALAGDSLSFTGPVTTPDTSASEVGFKGTPLNIQTDNYTLVLTDAGKSIQQNGNAKTITIPANASVAFPVGTMIHVFMAGTSGTLAITSDTLTWAGTTSTGSRTLAQNAWFCLYKYSSTVWIVSGVGVS